MWRLLFLLSILPVIGALIARWYFGLRVLAIEGKRLCRFDRVREVYTGENSSIEIKEGPAAGLGKLLHTAALAEWKTRDPKRAAARESARKFGLAVPPIALIIAIFAMIVGRVSIYGGFVLFLAAIALSVVTNLLTLGTELTAIAITSRKLREARAFTTRDDEEAVTRSALAHAWADCIPPILRFL
jgi:hypothetical protein